MQSPNRHDHIALHAKRVRQEQVQSEAHHQAQLSGHRQQRSDTHELAQLALDHKVA